MRHVMFIFLTLPGGIYFWSCLFVHRQDNLKINEQICVRDDPYHYQDLDYDPDHMHLHDTLTRCVYRAKE